MEAEALLILRMIEKQASFFWRQTEVIDELKSVVDILREKKLGEGSDKLNYFISDLLQMANETFYLFEETYIGERDSILCWMREIKIRMLKLGVDGAETKSNMISDDEDVVGLEEDVQQLLHTEILNDESHFSSLLIKGMVGIGKTTLARQLYNHAAVVDAFECRAWVCVSTDLTIKEVLIKLIQQVADSKKLHSHMSSLLEGADIPALQRMLHQHLQGVRYLIVLDDVPKHMRLRTILKALPHDDDCSTCHQSSAALMITKNLPRPHEAWWHKDEQQKQIIFNKNSFIFWPLIVSADFPSAEIHNHLSRPLEPLFSKSKHMERQPTLCRN